MSTSKVYKLGMDCHHDLHTRCRHLRRRGPDSDAGTEPANRVYINVVLLFQTKTYGGVRYAKPYYRLAEAQMLQSLVVEPAP
jgi:hypothetical protein